MIQALDSFVALVPHLITAITALGALAATIIGLMNGRKLSRGLKSLENQDIVMGEISHHVDGGNATVVAATKSQTDELANVVKDTADKVADELHAKIDGLSSKVDEQASEILRLHGLLEPKP
jgi:predicted AlkP superfamily phosphohydrolase/phosphomutase